MLKSLERSTKARSAARNDFQELCDLRIEAASKELHYDPIDMRCGDTAKDMMVYFSFWKSQFRLNILAVNV